jgi:hypothetical protein
MTLAPNVLGSFPRLVAFRVANSNVVDELARVFHAVLGVIRGVGHVLVVAIALPGRRVLLAVDVSTFATWLRGQPTPLPILIRY